MGGRGGSLGVRLYGRVGYAIFDSQGRQKTRAVFGFPDGLSKGYPSGKAEAEASLARLKKLNHGNNGDTVRRAVNWY